MYTGKSSIKRAQINDSEKSIIHQQHVVSSISLRRCQSVACNTATQLAELTSTSHSKPVSSSKLPQKNNAIPSDIKRVHLPSAAGLNIIVVDSCSTRCKTMVAPEVLKTNILRLNDLVRERTSMIQGMRLRPRYQSNGTFTDTKSTNTESSTDLRKTHSLKLLNTRGCFMVKSSPATHTLAKDSKLVHRLPTKASYTRSTIQRNQQLPMLTESKRKSVLPQVGLMNLILLFPH